MVHEQSAQHNILTKLVNTATAAVIWKSGASFKDPIFIPTPGQVVN